MEDHYLIEARLKRNEIDSFDNYPFCLNGVKSLESISTHPAGTFFIGENGSGKSTLLEAIAVALGFNHTTIRNIQNFSYFSYLSPSASHR